MERKLHCVWYSLSNRFQPEKPSVSEGRGIVESVCAIVAQAIHTETNPTTSLLLHLDNYREYCQSSERESVHLS